MEYKEKEDYTDRMNRILGIALTPLTATYCQKENYNIQMCLSHPEQSNSEECLRTYKQMRECFNYVLTEANQRCPKQLDKLYKCLDKSDGDMKSCKKQYDTFLNCWNKSL
ncbi:hypothetical protein WA158_000421 [Blastocystis sp. Blastoise]